MTVDELLTQASKLLDELELKGFNKSERLIIASYMVAVTQCETIMKINRIREAR
jgi:hypothetical protein